MDGERDSTSDQYTTYHLVEEYVCRSDSYIVVLYVGKTQTVHSIPSREAVSRECTWSRSPCTDSAECAWLQGKYCHCMYIQFTTYHQVYR